MVIDVKIALLVLTCQAVMLPAFQSGTSDNLMKSVSKAPSDGQIMQLRTRRCSNRVSAWDYTAKLTAGPTYFKKQY